MNKKTIGHIILKGGTSEDIRKEFPDFPVEPTKEFFCSLGYKESTAKSYVYKLKSSKKKSDSNDIPEDMFVVSKDADYNNLLVDTCVLAHNETLELLEKAAKATFIYPIIEEMDRKKKFNQGKTNLASNIKVYINKMLQERDKYMLSAFNGITGENYPDNILLQYMKILPTQIRPTLFTADKNLATKAEMWDLQYILFDVAKRPRKFPLGFGIYKVISNNEVYIDYNGKQTVSIIHGGSETFYEGKRLKVEHGDRVCIYLTYDDKVVPTYVM